MIIVAAIVSFLFCIAVPSLAVESQPIQLDGLHRISAGDDLRWALPEHDDSGWSSIHVPGGWQSQALSPENGIGWYRIRFSVPADFQEARPALFLGRIGNADEVFLNGERIGGEGVVGDRYVEAHWKQRLYRVPPGSLRAGAFNLLSIRVLNTYSEGGLIDGPVCIGDFEEQLAGATRL